MNNRSKAPRKGLQRLLEERHRRRWTQRDLAEKLDTTVLTVSRWERGITVPSSYHRQRLCEVFSKSPRELGFISEEEVEQGNMEEYPAQFLPQLPIEEEIRQLRREVEILLQDREILKKAMRIFTQTHP